MIMFYFIYFIPLCWQHQRLGICIWASKAASRQRKVEDKPVYEIKIQSRPSKAGIRQRFVIST